MLRQALNHFGQTVMRVYAGTLLDMMAWYQSYLPAGPKILAANHPTMLDPFLLLTITSEEVSILITEFCFALPVFGRYLHGAGHIPVMTVGEPMYFDGDVDDRVGVRMATDRIMQRIEDLSALSAARLPQVQTAGTLAAA